MPPGAVLETPRGRREVSQGTSGSGSQPSASPAEPAAAEETASPMAVAPPGAAGGMDGGSSVAGLASAHEQVVSQPTGPSATGTSGQLPSLGTAACQRPVLYAFSGSDRGEGSFARHCEKLGRQVHMMDTELDAVEHDLADDRVWRRLESQLRSGAYAAALWSPPCSTFSRVRSRGRSGPRPLRDPWGKGLSG